VKQWTHCKCAQLGRRRRPAARRQAGQRVVALLESGLQLGIQVADVGAQLDVVADQLIVGLCQPRSRWGARGRVDDASA